MEFFPACRNIEINRACLLIFFGSISQDCTCQGRTKEWLVGHAREGFHIQLSASVADTSISGSLLMLYREPTAIFSIHDTTH